MNTIYYLEEKFIEYRQNELIAEARREAMVRELKQSGKQRTKAGDQKREHKVKFNWFFGTKNRSASPMN
ncbi:MAG: hypothetical protein BGO39_09360 [Chloroflexi bacterium 54-19]|nr:MAG: hypothetical protein BGO39_09360 [Chloroflexi bacterium 54-19]